MNYIVYDLEATCWDDRQNRVQEIIEIGALKINEEGEILSRFESFIRPIVNQTLSDFCKQLTSISQVEINQSDTFDVVIDDFQEWIGVYDDEEYLLCSWGFFDQKAFKKDCELHEMDTDWTFQHISLKHQYQEIMNLRKPMGLRRAVEKEGFDFEGTHHRGIDDAENLAKVFIKYVDLWRY